MDKKQFNLLLFGFLLIITIGFLSALSCAIVPSNNCEAPSHIVMRLSGATNAHGALATQLDFSTPDNRTVCCQDTGIGDSTCSSTLDPDTNQPINKIVGLSAATNAHAEIPDLISPSYNTYNVCYGDLVNCSSTITQNRVEVIDLSSDTNAHLGIYSTKIYCAVSESLLGCDLTSASWASTQIVNGSPVEMIVGGTAECVGETISFAVKRGGSVCNDCQQPANVAFGQNGTWTAGPANSNENYTFTATVVGSSPTESFDSTNNLQVLAECLYDPKPVLCSGYTNANDCNSNICKSVVFPPEDINPRCEWLDNTCKLVSDPPQEVSIVVNPQNPVIDVGLVKSFTVDVYLDGVLASTGREPTSCASSNPAIANKTVGSVCSFKGESVGTATITASYDSGGGVTVQDTTTLTVNTGPAEESEIKLIPSDSIILVSATQAYNAILVWSNLTEVSVTSQTTFSSSNTTIATISGNVATGLSEGITTIRGTRTGGTITATLPTTLAVYRDPPPYSLESIEVSPSGGNVQLGKTFSATGGFGVYALYTDSSENDWVTVGNTAGVSDCVSSNPSIASRVGITGCKFRGNAIGTVTITAVYTETGITKQDTSVLNVVPDSNVGSHIVLVPTERRISVGGTVSYTSWLYWSDPEALPLDVTSQTTFSSSSTAVATISGNVATGKSRGSSGIRGTYNTTYSGLALLHVGPIQPPIPPPGICIWDQIVEGSCAEGDEFITVRTIPGPGSSPSCIEKPSKAVVCPAQIPLPFFTFYNILAAVVIIAAIYWAIDMRKSRRKR